MRVVRTDASDRLAWQEAILTSNQLEDTLVKNEDAIGDLVADGFQLLKQRLPVWDSPTQMPTLHEMLLREQTQTQEFKQLKALVGGDQQRAAFATNTMAEAMVDRLKNSPLTGILEDQWKAMNQLEQAEIDAALAAQEADADPNNAALQQAMAQAQQRAAQQRTVYVAVAAQSPPETSPDVEAFRRSGRAVAAKAVQQLQDLSEMEDLLGNQQSGQGSSLEAKTRLAKRMKHSRKLQDFAELAGRMKRVMLAKKASVVREVKQETIGVKMGDDLTSLVPSEFALLADIRTKAIFWKKFVEKQLLMWDKKGEEKLGSGPIILCIDESGSMMGQRELWSKAIMMAFMAVAEKERRFFAVAKFTESLIAQDIYEFDYTKVLDQINREQVLECIETFRNGGTDFVPPLSYALSRVEKEKNDKWKTADIIFLTDGECAMDPGFVEQFNKRRKELGVQAFGVVIGGNDGSGYLRSVMDEVAHITDLTRDDAVTDMLFKR